MARHFQLITVMRKACINDEGMLVHHCRVQNSMTLCNGHVLPIAGILSIKNSVGVTGLCRYLIGTNDGVYQVRRSGLLKKKFQINFIYQHCNALKLTRPVTRTVYSRMVTQSQPLNTAVVKSSLCRYFLQQLPIMMKPLVGQRFNIVLFEPQQDNYL